MKTIAYTALHYGIDYLDYAIRSVIDAVDEYHVLYTPVGSHGSRANVRCPESRHELYRLVVAAAGNKLNWHDGEWSHEGEQRDDIFRYAPDAGVVLVLDSDEIWAPGSAKAAVYAALDGDAREYRIPIIHYWRSFYRCVLHDPAFPIRVIVPGRMQTVPQTIQVRPINHMGYAQRSQIVLYKLFTHGHRSQFRGDIDWYRDRFIANAQRDCHPVGSEYWNPEQVNPLDYMPGWMADHPYFKMEVIP